MIIGLVVVVGGVLAFLFVFDTESLGGGDNETAKINGGYETLKSDLVSTLGIRDGQAASIGDTFFDTIGISKYESMTTPSLRGNLTVNADGFSFDCMIIGGDFSHAYIGNALIYKSPKSTAVTVANALEYSYKQYKTLVNAFIRALKISDENAGKQLYQGMTLLGVRSFMNIKSGKLEDMKGYYGYDGNIQYFMTLNDSNTEIKKIYLVCDGFDPFEVYNSLGTSEYKLSDVNPLPGTRQGLAEGMAYKVKNLTELEVLFPNALLSGDDSWLMVQKDGEIYCEVSAEVKSGSKTKVQNCYIKLDAGYNIIYLKIGSKVYVK